MLDLKDLQALRLVIQRFEDSGCLAALDIEALQDVCLRVLAADPLERLGYEVQRLIDHAREMTALGE